MGGGVKYFGRTGDYGGTASLNTQDKGMKESSQLFLAAHIFLGLTASFALCKGRLTSREDYSFVLTAGWC